MQLHKWHCYNLCRLKKTVAVPSTVHADHLIQAKIGADKDLQEALNQNNEVLTF